MTFSTDFSITGVPLLKLASSYGYGCEIKLMVFRLSMFSRYINLWIGIYEAL